MKKRKRVIFVFVLLLAVLYVIIYVVPKVTGAIKTTVVAEYRPFQVIEKREVLVVRDETVYLANRSGVPNYFVPDGTVVRKGTQIMEIGYSDKKPTDERVRHWRRVAERYGEAAIIPDNYYAKSVGMVSYFVDEYSSKLKISEIDKITQEGIDNFEPKAGSTVRGNREVVEGQPLFKISDHGKWYMILWVDEGEVGNYSIGNNLKVRFDGATVSASVDKIQEQEDEYKIILKCNQSFPGFLAIRRSTVDLIIRDYEGLAVPNESIVTKDKKAGVYVKSKTGEFVFKPIMIITSNGVETLIKEGVFYSKENGEPVETVNVYDEILKKP